MQFRGRGQRGGGRRRGVGRRGGRRAALRRAHGAPAPPPGRARHAHRARAAQVRATSSPTVHHPPLLSKGHPEERQLTRSI